MKLKSYENRAKKIRKMNIEELINQFFSESDVYIRKLILLQIISIKKIKSIEELNVMVNSNHLKQILECSLGY
jgi:hypothetical protein